MKTRATALVRLSAGRMVLLSIVMKLRSSADDLVLATAVTLSGSAQPISSARMRKTKIAYRPLCATVRLAQMSPPEPVQRVGDADELGTLGLAVDMGDEARPRVIDIQMVAACAEL